MEPIEFYELVLDFLRSDNSLKSLVGDVYEHIPEIASVPYVYLQLHHCEITHVFTGTVLKVYLICGGCSYNVKEAIGIMQCTRRILSTSSMGQNRVIEQGYKVVQKRSLFYSYLNIGALIHDNS